MNLLITGGAGYIGSHLCKLLAARGDTVTVLDNLSTGHRWAVRWGELIEADLRDLPAVEAALRGRGFDAVVHFGAMSLVGESMTDPGKYYLGNVGGTVNLLVAMQRAGVPAIVFSSSAAVYGSPERTPIPEDHPRRPINPYGRTKAMIEDILADFEAAHGLRSVALRYFNAAGASRDGDLGEVHEPETHLIPNVLRAAAAGRPVSVFGDAYPTPDGTCVRDYIHVEDLADAHVAALEHLRQGGASERFNLGTGHGYSVREVIDAAGAVIGRPVAMTIAPPRPGDPPVLVAEAARARKALGWTPTRSDLRTILETAWAWEQTGKPRVATYP
jgi:UDP-glucose-4-epimerase GalE